jgi:hypothetical protein
MPGNFSMSSGGAPQFLGDLHWNFLVQDPKSELLPIKEGTMISFMDEKAGIRGFLSDAGEHWVAAKLLLYVS